MALFDAGAAEPAEPGEWNARGNGRPQTSQRCRDCTSPGAASARHTSMPQHRRSQSNPPRPEAEDHAPSGPAALGGAIRRNEERPMPVQAPAPSPASAGSASDQDGKKLIVGKQIVLSGEIKACEKLIVEGRVEAALTDCHSIAILQDGLFKGAASIDIADISGRFEGDLIVRQRLMLRSTGHIAGNVRYGEVEIERGGVIAGDMRPIAEGEKRPGFKIGSGGADDGARGS
jgi:cytoskeletal protein CcmA (bactofilin family)